MSQNRNFKIPPRNVMDDNRLKLYGDKLPECKSSPTLCLRMVRSENKNKETGKVTISVNPRLVVYTNIPGDKDNGKIQAGMDLMTFTTFLNEMEKVVTGKSDGFRIKNSNYTWFNNQRSEKPKHLSTTMVGVDDGKVFITVVAADRPKVKFYFQSPQYHQLAKVDGTAYTPAEDSTAFATGWMKLLGRVSAPLMSFLGQEADDASQPSGSGGGNRSGGSDGGYGGGQKKAASKHGGFDDFDDDIL